MADGDGRAWAVGADVRRQNGVEVGRCGHFGGFAA